MYNKVWQFNIKGRTSQPEVPGACFRVNLVFPELGSMVLIAHVYVCTSDMVRSLRFVSDVTSSGRSEDEGRLDMSGA